MAELQYITEQALRDRLTSESEFTAQQPDGADYTAFLTLACVNATGIVNAYIGDDKPFAFETLGSADVPAERTYTGDSTDCLALDLPLQQFVSASNAGSAVSPADVWLEPINSSPKTAIVLQSGSWSAQRHGITVAGVWGWGAPPAEVIEAVTEIAVRIVKGRAAGYSDVVGVNPDGTQSYIKALPPLVKLALDLAKKRYQIQAAAGDSFGSFGVA